MPEPLQQGQPVDVQQPEVRPLPSLLSLVLTLLFWLALWALLSAAEGWYVGLPLALLATWLCLRLKLSIGPLRLQYLPSFLLFFLMELFSGGWDVARRAFHPRRPLAPAWVTLELRCQDARVQLLLSAMVGLLPGTLASHHDTRTLHIHALDARMDWQDTARRLEYHLARVLAEPLP